jgi:hypothetical protein
MMKKILPRLEPYTDFATYNVAGDDEECVAAAIEHIEETHIPKFLAAVPGYYPSHNNAERLAGWCTSRGVPMSLWNLTIAYRDLTEDGQLEAPPPAAQEVDNSRGIIPQVGDALLEYQTPADEQAALAKVKDDSSLSDRARKNRDERLRLLAGRQRRELAPQNLYR